MSTAEKANLTQPAATTSSDRALLGAEELNLRWRLKYHGNCAKKRVRNNVNYLDHNILNLDNRSVSVSKTRDAVRKAYLDSEARLYESVDPGPRRGKSQENVAAMLRASMAKTLAETSLLDMARCGFTAGGNRTEDRKRNHDLQRDSQIPMKQTEEVSYDHYKKNEGILDGVKYFVRSKSSSGVYRCGGDFYEPKELVFVRNREPREDAQQQRLQPQPQRLLNRTTVDSFAASAEDSSPVREPDPIPQVVPTPVPVPAPQPEPTANFEETVAAISSPPGENLPEPEPSSEHCADCYNRGEIERKEKQRLIEQLERRTERLDSERRLLDSVRAAPIDLT